MKLAWLNPPSAGWASTPEAARNQANGLRRLKEKKERQARKAQEEQPEEGLRRFLKADPAVEETMQRAGL
ncbi:hypothetical protein EH240_34085 [Mesorhizobium tamadayense]|uniref:Uncharacterized protein n=1 Tax=Mesorhizobium tamadayense TaxID=425306 RepID=A0A3P3EUF8_9HYPH|nr:hypothetical protein [Mesorhizobium tamadayense]RRH89472.1 hypothetical protein EH240_34085 [Mesorhizobium tamadayense]